MPCVTLHCIIHLIPEELQASRFPAIHTIIHSAPTSPEHYTLLQMMFWASWPYAVWQLAYHVFISVRRKDKIAAGRPTSFTWLRKSYNGTGLGKLVLSLPENMQEAAYMLIQYAYALGTMLPCPLWFWSRWASGLFLASVFTWSVWNGATYYIDVFGVRFQRELEALKKDVAKWQNTPELQGRGGLASPLLSPEAEASPPNGEITKKQDEEDMENVPINTDQLPSVDGGVGPGKDAVDVKEHEKGGSLEKIPLLDETGAKSPASGAQTEKPDEEGLRERKQ
jgi:hypothetical protein